MSLWKNLMKPDVMLAFILFGGLILRLIGALSTYLAGDLVLHWKIAGDIVSGINFPLLGPQASMNDNFHLGPFYYYILAGLYLFSGGNFQMGVMIFSFINILSGILLYIVCRRWFTQNQSLQIVALYSFSNYFIGEANYPWNPHLLPSLLVVTLYILTKIQNFKIKYVPILFLMLGLLLQAHATAVFLLPVFLLLLPLKKIKLKQYMVSFFLFLLPLSPWILHNLLFGFSEARESLNILFERRDEGCNFIQWLNYHGHGESCFQWIRNTLFSFRFFEKNLFNVQEIKGAIYMVLLVSIFFLKVNCPQKKLVTLWLLIPMFFFLFYSSNIYIHYFLILYPIPFIITVMVLDKVKDYGKAGKAASQIIFLYLLAVNILGYLGIASLPSP